MFMQDSLQIFTASSGKLSARVLLDNDTTRHIHSTVKPEAEADYFEDLTFWGNVIVFKGIGLGYHLGGKIKNVPPSALLIVIDYYDKLIDNCMDTIFTNLPNNIFSVSASNYKQKKSELIKSLKTIPSPIVQTIKHPASFDIHRNFYEDILSIIYPSSAQQQTKTSYIKKALLVYGKFFLQEEIRRALRKLYGEDPILFLYESLQSGMEYESQLQKIIQSERPDFILSINMKGFDGNGILSDTALRFGVPIIVWFVDDPHPILLHQGKFIGKHIIAMCWEKAYLPYLKECGFGKVGYLPLATDPDIFSCKIPASPMVRIGFVGTSMGSAFLANIQSKFLWSDALIPLVDKASDILLTNPDARVLKIIRDVSHEMSFTIPFSDDRNFTWLCSYIIHNAGMKKRKSLIESLMPAGIETFGDPEGWKELLGPDIPTHPDIDYSTQLFNTYRDIEINLNVTSCQMPSAVNQRVFDIPMSGSFVISDNQKDLGELFEIGKEAVCYKDIEELKDIVSYYLDRQESQLQITAAAKERIRNEHTYFHRVKSIMEALKK